MNPEVYKQFYEIEKHHWWFAGMRRIYQAMLKGLPLDRTCRILDIGCGTGFNLSWLGEIAPTVGLDASLDATAFWDKGPGGRFVLGSGTALPFVADAFELVTAFGVIEHIEDDRTMLAEMHRVCRPGGHLLLSTSAHPWLWSSHDVVCRHKRRYRLDEFSRIMTDVGFEIRRLSYVNAILFVPIALTILLMRLLSHRVDTTKDSAYLSVPSFFLNNVLRSVLSSEAVWLRHSNLPLGVGLLCLAQK